MMNDVFLMFYFFVFFSFFHENSDHSDPPAGSFTVPAFAVSD